VTSATNLSFAHCSSSLRGFPRPEEAKPHCGDSASRSSDTTRAAASIRRTISSFFQRASLGRDKAKDDQLVFRGHLDAPVYTHWADDKLVTKYRDAGVDLPQMLSARRDQKLGALRCRPQQRNGVRFSARSPAHSGIEDQTVGEPRAVAARLYRILSIHWLIRKIMASSIPRNDCRFRGLQIRQHLGSYCPINRS
jgi:hypothetical protein